MLAAAVESHGGVPLSLPELKCLPLVGDYTAKATLLTLGYRCQVPFDVNVNRIAVRLWGALPKRVLEKRLDRFTGGGPRKVFFALIDLGAFVCRPTNPKCEICPLSNLCTYYESRREKQGKQKARKSFATSLLSGGQYSEFKYLTGQRHVISREINGKRVL